MERRIVGIDLGVASEHTVRVLAGDGTVLAKRRASPTKESLSAIEEVALAGTAEGTTLEVVMEPTGPAWLPVATFFCARGHRVYRVSSQQSADMRRFFSRHAKSNGIDADALARLPLVAPGALRPLVLPGADRAALDRRVRATDRLTRQAAAHKVRLKSLVRQLLPMSPLEGDLGQADLAVLERYADPRRLLAAGRARLGRVMAAASRGQLGAARAEEWLAAARAALDLYGASEAVAFEALAEEVESEVRLLRAAEAELARHAKAREAAYRRVDPGQLARSLPGLAEVGGPALVAVMGDPARFSGAAAFRRFTGLAPKASETGDTDRKGQPISKAGSSLLRTTLVRAADTARRQDPQLAAVYHAQMVERGKSHLGAVCVVAAELAERAFVVMARGAPYELRDLDGRPVSLEEARSLIASHFTVPAEVRARRRGTKVGKAPQSAQGTRALGARGHRPEGPDRRGDLPRPHSSRRRAGGQAFSLTTEGP